MDSLYDKIDAVQKFTAPVTGVPPTDHTQQVNLGMDWASRQQQRPAPAPEPPRMPAIVPVAN